MLDRHSLLTTLSSTGFNPKSIPGLAVWLDAQDAGSFTYSTGSDVSAWADGSGNSNNATQGTAASQPLYVASGINGKPAVQFFDDSTNKFLQIADAASLNFTACHVFIVMRPTQLLGANMHLFAKWTIATNEREIKIPIITGTNTIITQASLNGTAVTSTAASATAAINTNYIVEGYFASSLLGSITNNSAAVTAALASINNATSPVFIGTRDTNTEPFAGYIGEILFYTASLTAAQRATVIRYLSTKWGV